MEADIIVQEIGILFILLSAYMQYFQVMQIAEKEDI